MRWTPFLVFFCLHNSVISTKPNDGEPFLRVVPKSSVYDVGEKRALYCEGLNLPERIEWYNPAGDKIEDRDLRKNVRIKVERPKHSNLESSMVGVFIESTQIEDSGNWTCKAGDLVQTIEVHVGEKVQFDTKYTTLEGEAGGFVKLECAAKGYPEPVVQWYKDNTAIVESKKYRIKKPKEDHYDLEIRDLNYTDSGEYMCKVTQEALSHYTDKQIKLTVQHKPVIRDKETQDVIANTYRAQEIYAIISEIKNLTCSAIAHPPPTYKWYRRHNGFDDHIHEEDTVFTAENGEYSVMQLRLYNESFLGEYKCTAENDKGIASIIFHVSLGNKPQAPDFVNLTSANVTHLTFNVTCSTCKMEDEEGVPPDPKDLKIISYSFEFVPVHDGYPVPDWDLATEISVDIEDPEETLFEVGPLDNSTTYHARLRSKNLAGFSEWVEITPNPATANSALRLAATTLLSAIALFIVNLY